MSSRKGGKPEPVGISAKEFQARRRDTAIEKRFKAARPTVKRKKRKVKRRIPAHRHKVISVPVRRRKKARTHRSPRHTGHKRVSFTTKDGQKVSFLSNPKARHRK